MTTHDPMLLCQQFCTEPIGPDGHPGDEAILACCPTCDEKLSFLCREVMPAIRRDGYYSPAGSTVDDEFADMGRQDGFRPAAVALLDELFGTGSAAALGWHDAPGGAS